MYVFFCRSLVFVTLFEIISPHTTKNSSGNKNTTFCIVARAHLGEAPYLKSFVDYNNRLGISKFYFILTESKFNFEFERLVYSMFMEPVYDGIITFFRNVTSDTNRKKHMEYALADILQSGIIKEDFMLHIDIDEYLDISPWKTLQQYTQKYPFDTYAFPWQIAVGGYDQGSSNSYSHSVDVAVFKSMGRTSLVRSMTVHRMRTVDGNITSMASVRSDHRVLHYWGRSLKDVLLKSLFGDNGDSKTSSLDQLKACAAGKGALPPRLKLLAVLTPAVLWNSARVGASSNTSASDSDSTSVPSLVQVNGTLEDALLEGRLSGPEVARIRAAFLQYARALDPKYLQLYLQRKYNLIGLVPHLP